MIYRDILTGDILDLHETTEHAAASYGQSVLVDRNGYAWDRWTVRPVQVEAKRYRLPRPESAPWWFADSWPIVLGYRHGGPVSRKEARR